LLGAILVNNAAYDRVQDFLEASHFYEPLHRKIFDIASQMIRKGKLVNPMLIKSFLPADDTMGNMTVQQYLIRLAVEATTIVNARDYGLAVHEMWIRREAIASVEDVASIAYDLPADEDMLTKIAPLEDRLASLRAERVRGESRKGAGQEYIDDMTAANQRGDVRGVPICLDEISDVISEPCFEAGNLYGLLSSSGEGKTSLTLQMISHALRKGHPVQFLSYDQNRVQCVRQMIAQEYGIEARRQRNPKLLAEKEWEQCVGFATWLDRQPFEVLKCTDQSAPQLAGFARTFVKRFSNGKVPFIVVDHIQSVEPEDRRADPGTKAKGINKIFKAAAETTASAWLILNQRNSEGKARENPRPIKRDVFGGDPAIQAYDAMFYLYRQESYKAERVATAASDMDWKKINKVFGQEIAGLAEIGGLKVRFGNPTITRELRFEDRFTRYKSERVEPQQELL
jgi:replicative DNA helicase